jgi:hypothetical protein
MTQIFKTNTSKIIKQSGSKYKISLDDGEKYTNYFASLKKNFKLSKSDKTSFVFEAKNIETLNSLLTRKYALSYRHLKQLFTNIAKQLENLEKDKFCNFLFNLKDIVRIELDSGSQDGGTGGDVFFLYLNTEHFLPIKLNKMKIIKPFNKKNMFFSPEIKNITQLPTEISTKSQFFSLSLLTLYCCTKFDKLDYNKNSFEQHLSHIENTKLYWAILRCLENNPTDRIYLYI